MDDLKMLNAEEVAGLINTSRQHVAVLNEIGILKGIKTGKGIMFSRDEIKHFQAKYKGMDVSNKVKAIEAYRVVNAG